MGVWWLRRQRLCGMWTQRHTEAFILYIPMLVQRRDFNDIHRLHIPTMTWTRAEYPASTSASAANVGGAAGPTSAAGQGGAIGAPTTAGAAGGPPGQAGLTPAPSTSSMTTAAATAGTGPGGPVTSSGLIITGTPPEPRSGHSANACQAQVGSIHLVAAVRLYESMWNADDCLRRLVIGSAVL